MDTSAEAGERQRRNQEIRRQQSQLEPENRKRADRLAVYAVAVGHILALSDEHLQSLRELGSDDPILKVVRQFDQLVRPATGEGTSEDEALSRLAETEIDGQGRRIVEALRQIQPAIQPVNS
jgi:hypothetical protein